MDEENHNKPFSSRYRSPVFSKEEVEELVNLVDKYKHIIMHKSICASVCHAKDAAWLKITKIFNKRGFEYMRSVESLKRKWENLKKDARKVTKNLMDTKVCEFNELDAKIVSILCESENISTSDSPLDINVDDSNNENEQDGEEDKEQSTNTGKYSEYSMPDFEDGEKQSDNESIREDGNDHNEENPRIARALNFSPKECSFLLQCVRQEKQHVFCKDITGQAIKLKNRAWSRITNSYNKVSPRKRSTKVLRTKFSNMKRLAKKVGFKGYMKGFESQHESLIDPKSKDIKREYEYNLEIDGDSDWHANNDEQDLKTDNNFLDFTPDPLSSVLNSDSGLGSSRHTPLNQSEDKEVVKLKMELLNYKIETAKLERKRLEDMILEETAARESRTIETALKLRAARLDAIAAEKKFPISHPALHYTPDEIKAQNYLSQYQP